jgi:signal transduction histidine kinase
MLDQNRWNHPSEIGQKRLMHSEYGATPSDHASISNFFSREDVHRLTEFLDQQHRTIQQINRVTSKINAGILLTDILDMVYEEFHAFIPYDRIGLSIIEYDENGDRVLRSEWARNRSGNIEMPIGYRAPLKGSSMEDILDSLRPRVINDLEAYAKQKPESKSTKMILAEGIRSSLTCPLIVNGNPVGFMFFSSNQPYAYASIHIDMFQQIAGQLSVIVEKGWLITELAQKQAKIEEQNQELQRLNRMKNEFLGMAAHDLRNPIGHIESVVQMLLDPNWTFSEEEEHNFLTGIVRQTSYVMDMLDDMLNVTQLDSGKLTIRRIEIDIFELLRETVNRHNRTAGMKDSTVDLTVTGTPKMMLDPLRMRQVLDNMISNAIKYSPPGSQIQVRGQQNGDHWFFEVQDQGPGILPEEADKVFMDFVKLSAEPTAGEPSVGLGLAVTKRLVEAQDGEIGFHNYDGETSGAIFWFTLPHITADNA